jgi:autotransporter adhesin
VTTTAGNNIAITQNGTDLTIATNPDLVSSSLTTSDGAGNTTVTNGSGVTTTDASGNSTSVSSTGVTITPAGGGSTVSLTNTGLNNGGNKITNVAAGTVSSTSTDAVNGSQLYAVENTVNNAVNGGGIKYFHANSAAPDSAAVGTDSVAVGPSAVANGNTSIAQGAGAVAGVSGDPTVANDVAIGTSATATGGSSLAIGSGASVSTSGGVALGAGSVATRSAGNYVDPITGTSFATLYGAVSVGTLGGLRQITNVAPGTQPTDAVNLSQLEGAIGLMSSTLSNEISNSTGAPVSSGGSVSNGNEWVAGNPVTYTAPTASGTGSTAVGSGSVASGNGSTAIGDGANASGANSVALGANSVADAPNTVSVGSPGNERTISNVAPGVNGTDAVNLNQLNAGVAQANQYTDQQVNNLRRDLNAGVAAAMAVAGLPQPTAPGKSMVSVAASTWQGQQGIAVGLSTISENGRWVYKGSLTTSTRGGTGAAIGAGFQW